MTYYFILHGGEKDKQNMLKIIACKKITTEDGIEKDMNELRLCSYCTHVF